MSAAERRSPERRAARERADREREGKEKARKRGQEERKSSPKSRPVSKARERRERERREESRPSPRPRHRAHRVPRERYVRPEGPGPARLFALAAGAFLTLLGVLGFFYDASFDTGVDLRSDDLAGILMVNGWRNVVYVVTGLLALGLAPRRPRATAAGLGLFYLGFAVWGFIVTERDIGDILSVLPLGNEDNVLHLILGILGLFTALVDQPLPPVPEGVRKRLKRKPRTRRNRQRSASGDRRRMPSPTRRPTARKPIAKNPKSGR
jgi:hypothetical protein